MACSTFLVKNDDVVESVLRLEGGRGGSRETNDVAAGRSAGYVTLVEVTSVSGIEDCELTLLTLDFALDLALDLELARADNFDFFSLFPLWAVCVLFALRSLFTLNWLAVSSPGFTDRANSDADDSPPGCGRSVDFDIQSGMSGMLSMEGKSTTVGGRELSLSDEGSE